MTSDYELLWPFPTIVEGIQVDSLSTQEFANFQHHWLSANKTIFPGSSFDTTEVKVYAGMDNDWLCACSLILCIASQIAVVPDINFIILKWSWIICQQISKTP